MPRVKTWASCFGLVLRRLRRLRIEPRKADSERTSAIPMWRLL